MTTDRFVGTWEMDASQNVYEMGEPPAGGMYIIEAVEVGYRVTMKWTTASGQAREMSYDAIPDGQVHEYIDNAGVTEVSMTRVDAHTLDSEAFHNGFSVAYARRVLSEDGQTMSVTQSGKMPDGKPFSNKSVYVRV